MTTARPHQPRHRRARHPEPEVLAPATRLIQTDQLPAGIDALVAADGRTVIVDVALSPGERAAAIRTAFAAIGRRMSAFTLPVILLARKFAAAPAAVQAAITTPAVVAGAAAVVAVAPSAGPPALPPPPRGAAVRVVAHHPRQRRRALVPQVSGGRGYVRTATPDPVISSVSVPVLSGSPVPSPSPTVSGPAPALPAPSVSVSVSAPVVPPVCLNLLGLVTACT